MTAATMVAGLALALELGVTPVVAGQARAADLVTAARAQLGAGNVDSGLVLLGLALDSGSVATERDRVNALVWRGGLQIFQGRDRFAPAVVSAWRHLAYTARGRCYRRRRVV